MSTILPHPTADEIAYPESDGQPMADNTLQFQWIVTLQGNLDALFRHDPDVFVAGDLLWYPVQGDPKTRIAPDALVVFGRPKGHRRSYLQWKEGGIAPQVTFEVLSHKNYAPEMRAKRGFYETYGVQEYYEYDPYRVRLRGWRRVRGRFREIKKIDGWASPLLGIRFDLSGPELRVFGPDGERFLTFVEQEQQTREAQARAAEAQARAEQERKGREEARVRAAEAQARAERLAAQLRALGIEPGE